MFQSNILLFLAFLGISAFSFSTFSPDIPKDVERKLRRDASRLALRLEMGNEDAQFAPVYISKGNTDALYQALGAVYLNAEEGKSLYRCNIHTYPSPSIDNLVLIYDRNVDWADPLRNGLTETNDVTFNKLLRKYNLFIERHVQWTERQDALTLRSRDPINMAAIASEFSSIEGIQETDLGIPKVLGSDIEASRIKDAWNLDYILRFGAWATGSGKSHTWRFQVTDKGSVTIKNETGDPVPKWMRCHFNPEAFVSKL